MKINVAGQQWTLKEFTPHTRDDDAMGRCDAKLGIIYISKDLKEPMKSVTLIHEWLHGVFDTYGYEHTEPVINLLATELYRQGFKIQKLIK